MPAPVLNEDPTILTTWFCPYAQRCLIAANLKQPALKYVSHELSFEELYGKPQWFKDLTALGLIPVIAYQHKAGDQHAPPPTAAAATASGVVVIRESLVCLEFLEDAYPKPALLPADPVGKAAARLIIQRFNDKAVPACFGLLAHQDPTMQAAAAASLDVELQWLVDVLHPVGPFALGPELSLVDCAVAPFIIRLFVLKHYRSYTSYQALQSGAVGRRLDQYCLALEQHPAVAATMVHPDGLDYKQQLLQSYARYADGSAGRAAKAS